jgi:thioredoxin 1
MKTIESEQEFYDVIAGDQVTVVKFFTTWCPDCKRLNGFIDDIIAEHSDKEWYEVNGEVIPDVSEKYEVRGVPSLLVYKNGEKIGHLHSKYTKSPEPIREFLDTVGSDVSNVE